MRNFLIFILFISFMANPNGLFAQNQHHILILNSFVSQNEIDKANQYLLSHQLYETNDAKLISALANVYYHQQNFKEAANLYLKTESLTKTDFNYELAQCYAGMHQNSFAIERLKKHLEQKTKRRESEIKSDAAFINLHGTQEWKEIWLTDWYSESEQWLAGAWYEFQNKRYYDALEILDRVKLKTWAHEAYFMKSGIYTAMNEPNNALIAIDKALEIKPEMAQYHYIKSALELETKNPRKALVQINEAIQLDSTQIEYYIQKAKTLFTLRQTTEASTLVSELVSIKPDAQMLELAANIMIQANESFEAIKYINQAIAIQPYNPDLYIQRADVYMQTNTYNFAEKDYGMAMDFYPFKGELYFKRGMARIKLGKTIEACSDFSKARNFGYVNADAQIEQYCRP